MTTTTREKMVALRASLMTKLGRSPTAREVAEAYGCTQCRVRQVLTSDELSPAPPMTRVPKNEWSDAKARLLRLDEILAKSGVRGLDELEEVLSARVKP